jgi:predicted  nucleic acid-binding Zn-ribbon protein
METEEKKSNRSAVLLIALLLLISAGFNIYQWKNQSETVVTYDSKVDSLMTVRIELERELASTSVELEKYRGMSVSLDSLLNDANRNIEAKEKKIRALIKNEKNSGKLNSQLKQELEELRKLKEDYLDQIDQLVAENKELKEQNVILQESVGGLKKDKTELEGKVNKASELKVEYIKVAAFKKKSSGKYVESAIAKRTNKLDMCFTVLDNAIATPGERMVYVVIKEPTGKVLAGYSKATFNDATSGEEIMASASQKMDFTGAKQNLCLSYENDERILTSGTYTFMVYIDGTLLGESAYMLK